MTYQIVKVSGRCPGPTGEDRKVEDEEFPLDVGSEWEDLIDSIVRLAQCEFDFCHVGEFNVHRGFEDIAVIETVDSLRERGGDRVYILNFSPVDEVDADELMPPDLLPDDDMMRRSEVYCGQV